MRDGVQILMRDGRQNYQPHALVIFTLVLDGVGAAVHRHLVAALYQPRRKLLREGFKSTVVGRDAPDAHNCKFHSVINSSLLPSTLH